MTGCFYRLEAGQRLPARLAEDMPAVLWLPTVSSPGNGDAVLTGRPIGTHAATVPLVSLTSAGGLQLHFPLEDTIRGILLEEYHSGLRPTVEMKLPFNYSSVPGWAKGIARSLLSGRGKNEKACPFPPPDSSYVVEWLRRLQPSPPVVRWPDGKRAVAVVTHDVDTGWIFRNPDWLERICDLEERHGFRGAWYCVPCNSQDAAADRAIRRLIDRGCEPGVHGYNHDAKWPLMVGREFEKRLQTVRDFASRWGAKGFRSEWLFRTPSFLRTLAGVFEYDSSVPSYARFMTRDSANGCSSCLPYRTHGHLLELPLSLPMDEDRHFTRFTTGQFWQTQVQIARRIAHLGGLIVVTLHPQPHQAANEETLQAVESTLAEISADREIWIARPCEVAAWVAQQGSA